MSRKFIRQIINQNFVYPNNQVSEYDIELVQDINDNSVSGLVNSFSTTTINSTGITISMNYTWNLNDAEPFIRNSNELSLISVHLMAPPQLYYKPFRTVYNKATSTITATTITETVTFTILPSQLALTSFVNGDYYFEIRFIGHTSIYPICLTLPITVLPTPTPTPTATSTPTPTPTTTLGPTPTPTTTLGPTPTPTETPIEEYYYYSIRRYDCNNSCAVVSPDLVGRSSTPLSTTSGDFYKVPSSGFGSVVFQVQTEITPAPFVFDVNMDDVSSSGSDCSSVCASQTL
jgi:hypothetical protein